MNQMLDHEGREDHRGRAIRNLRGHRALRGDCFVGSWGDQPLTRAPCGAGHHLTRNAPSSTIPTRGVARAYDRSEPVRGQRHHFQINGLMKLALIILLAGAWCSLFRVAGSQVLFEADFEKELTGQIPEGFLALDGAFVVREDKGNRVLELAGAPLSAYSILFGPPVSHNMSVTARVLGKNKGRRCPAFAVGLLGAGGYRLQVSPGRKELELFKADKRMANAPFDWQPGKWLWLRLAVTRVKEGEWQVRGKVWGEDASEPGTWAVRFSDTSEPRPGRALVLGCPIAGTPIWYDNLKVEETSPEQK